MLIFYGCLSAESARVSRARVIELLRRTELNYPAHGTQSSHHSICDDNNKFTEAYCLASADHVATKQVSDTRLVICTTGN
jgi:hypothetical protein